MKFCDLLDELPKFLHLQFRFSQSMFNPQISLDASSSTSDSFLLDEVLSNGGFLIYLLILVYCCLGLAVICDAYFVPAIQKLSHVWDLPPDIAGSTLMALGASVPELFASLIGVFVTEDDIGTGSIIGGACFNLIAVPAACAFVAATSFKRVLYLAPFPLIRNSAFYSITILVLVLVIKDNKVDIPEAIILLVMFFFYIAFMIYSAQLCSYFPGLMSAADSLTSSTSSTDSAIDCKGGDKLSHRKQDQIGQSEATEDKMGRQLDEFRAALNSQGAKLVANKFNQQISERTPLVVHPPMINDGRIKSRSSNNLYPALATIAQDNNKWTDVVDGANNNSNLLKYGATYQQQQQRQQNTIIDLSVADLLSASYQHQQPQRQGEKNLMGQLEAPKSTSVPLIKRPPEKQQPISYDEHNQKCWVQTKWIMIPMLPVTIIMCILTPKRCQNAFWSVWTFIVSIIMIGTLTYVAVWMVHLFGQFIGVPETVAGITILSWGTGIPELIASIVLIKRTAQADMAVCNAIGSNVIDLSFCLSLPWIIKCLIRLSAGEKAQVEVNSAALPVTCLTLLVTVLALLITFKCNKWAMTIKVGLWLTLIYILFVIVACYLEYNFSNSKEITTLTFYVVYAKTITIYIGNIV